MKRGIFKGILWMVLGAVLVLFNYLGVPFKLVIGQSHLNVGWICIGIGVIKAFVSFIPSERIEIVKEFFLFLKERKLWWMMPIFIILGLLIIFVLLTETTGGSFPFIYAIF